MDLATLVATYGYVAVILGTFIEGETILAIAGFLASQGYLSLWGIMLAGLVGSVLGDQIAFAIGRRRGAAVLARYPRLAKRVARANALLERNELLAIMGFRFVYGIRIITPIILGTGSISKRRFMALNVMSAVIWSVVVSSTGFLFGKAVLTMLHDIKRYEVIGICLIVAIGLTVWLARGIVAWWDARYYAAE